MTSTMPEPQMPVTPVSAVASSKPGSSDQSLGADDPEARLEGLAVDPHALDRARRRPLATADLGALEGRPGRARGGEQEVAVTQDDLGVRPDVDDELDDLALVRGLREDHPGGIGPDVAGDARQHIDPGTRSASGARAPLP